MENNPNASLSAQNSVNQQQTMPVIPLSSQQLPKQPHTSHIGGIIIAILAGLFVIGASVWIFTGKQLKPKNDTVPTTVIQPSQVVTPLPTKVVATPTSTILTPPTLEQFTQMSADLISQDPAKVAAVLGYTKDTLPSDTFALFMQTKSYLFIPQTFTIASGGKSATVEATMTLKNGFQETKPATMMPQNGKWILWSTF